MRISELSARSGVPVPTLKYYLREGLLPQGRATGATSAEYGGGHLERVRLIRALVESGGLSIAGVRKVLAALDSPPASRHALLGVAAYAAEEASVRTGSAGSQDAVDALLDGVGWRVAPDAPARGQLAAALDALDAAGMHQDRATLSRYAAAMHGVAEVDVHGLPQDDPAESLRRVVVGNVLVDPVLAALRRLAQEHVSSCA